MRRRVTPYAPAFKIPDAQQGSLVRVGVEESTLSMHSNEIPHLFKEETDLKQFPVDTFAHPRLKALDVDEPILCL